jgi:choline dehydrogenase-like flavoprotein
MRGGTHRIVSANRFIVVVCIKFEAERKSMGSSLVVAYDEVNDTFANKCSILLQLRCFDDKNYPKHIKVTVEWTEENDYYSFAIQ